MSEQNTIPKDPSITGELEPTAAGSESTETPDANQTPRPEQETTSEALKPEGENDEETSRVARPDVKTIERWEDTNLMLEDLASTINFHDPKRSAKFVESLLTYADSEKLFGDNDEACTLIIADLRNWCSAKSRAKRYALEIPRDVDEDAEYKKQIEIYYLRHIIERNFDLEMIEEAATEHYQEQLEKSPLAEEDSEAVEQQTRGVTQGGEYGADISSAGDAGASTILSNALEKQGRRGSRQ